MTEPTNAQEIIKSGEKAAETIQAGTAAESPEAAAQKIDAEARVASAEVDQVQAIALADDGKYTSPAIADIVQRARKEHDAAQAEIQAAAQKAKATIVGATKLKASMSMGPGSENAAASGGKDGPGVGEKIVDATIKALHNPEDAVVGAAGKLIDLMTGDGGKGKT